MSPVIELCVDDLAGVETATREGIDRVELCVELGCGGLTPPEDLIVDSLRVAPSGGLQILVRQKADSFVLTATEVEELCGIITRLRELTADARVPVGFVIGAVTADGRIDEEASAAFREAAGDRPLTFHRAFDTVTDQLAGIDALKELGYDRVLTTGGDVSVADAAALKALQDRAGADLIVLGSGGLRSHNVADISDAAQLREVHMRAPDPSGVGTLPDEVVRIVEALR